MLSILQYISGGSLSKCYVAVRVLSHSTNSCGFGIAVSDFTLIILIVFSISVAACGINIMWWFYIECEQEINVNHYRLHAFGPARLNVMLLLMCESSVAAGGGAECDCFVWLLLVK
jgi:hypothetical protein